MRIPVRVVPMSEMLIRKPHPGEKPDLQDIWSLVFGNTGLNSFFELLYDERLCIIADAGGNPAAVGYLIPTGDLMLNHTQVPCAMIYSVATLPEHRGKGFGTAVVRKLICLARELDFPALVLCPSDGDLFEYYRRHTELKEYFYIKEQILDYGQITKRKLSDDCMAMLSEVNVDEYIILRENLLSGTKYIRQGQNIIEYQVSLCKELGGGLFRIGDSCAVVEAESSGTVLIKELLTSGDNELDIAAAIASRFPAHSYIVRSPSSTGKGRRFGMLGLDTDAMINADPGTAEPWYGMGLD